MSSEPSIFNVSPKPFNKEIKAPTSKSYANRLLVLAALDPKPVKVEQLPPSSDVEAMLSCFEKIGLEVKREGSSVYINNSFPACETPGPHLLKTGDGGTTNRFLIPLLARGKEEYTIEPEGHMKNRPMDELVDILKSLGAHLEFKENDVWLKIKGPLTIPKKIEVDASQSTQFVTGLALSMADTEASVTPKTLEVSAPYWKLTEHLIERFKKGELSYVNPVDFSSLSYPLALAAVTGRVIVKNCHERDIFQADSVFLEILEKMGAKVEWTKEGLLVEKPENSLGPVQVYGSQCPDVIPTVLFTCAFADGPSVVKDLLVLTHKECDRFEEMIRMLEAFKVPHTVDRQDYEIKILGKPEATDPVDYDSPADHRMVMVAYLFQRVLHGGKLTNTQHVKKSFSNYFKIMEGETI